MQSSEEQLEGVCRMEKLGIYEYVAVMVPGVAFLFGLGVMLPDTNALLHLVLLPRDLGTATVHLVLAFAVGHMLQVVGQLLHEYYWADFGGLPTDWPVTREHGELSADHQELIFTALERPPTAELVEWRRAIATARTLVTASGFSRRLESFQANYGMFRSLAVAALALLFVTPWSNLALLIVLPLFCSLLAVSLLGMHRFGVHYARELFAAVRAWSHARAESGPAKSAVPAASEEKLGVYPPRAAIRRAAA